VSDWLVHDVGLLVAGTIEFTGQRLRHECRAVNDLLLGAGQIDVPAELLVARAGVR